MHINKGRLHAFRKLANEPLPVSDCHSKLRHDFLQSHSVERNICVSIAYDWMYLGFQSTAIQTEIQTVLKAARRIRSMENAKTLAVGETAVFSLAEAIAATTLNTIPSKSVVPDKVAIAKGIGNSLAYLVYRDERESCDGVVPPVDADDDPAYRSTDPFGNDYFCKLCSHELANAYFHCQGCEEMLQMDFNICAYCFAEEKYRTNVEMKPYAKGKTGCHVHHTANTSFNPCTLKYDDCSCESGCDLCACDCHSKFIKRNRFRSNTAARQLLDKCKTLAGDEMRLLGAAELETTVVTGHTTVRFSFWVLNCVLPLFDDSEEEENI